MNDAESIFLQAREMSGEKRRDFLGAACAGNPELRQRVESLLEVAGQANQFFGEGANDADDSMRLTGEDMAQNVEGEGEQIGNYRLLQRIGEGGMGVVYMAEQIEPVRRRVALKIVKLGMDTKAVVARFEAERQALAMMDHPGIAKVLDAGSTGSGRPFFVMELVQGVPITTYCDQNHLGLRERLELFIAVCRAIQSAHQKGVIHRDIKPSNVMVTIHYGDPMPKVIDFGVAKATSQRLTEKTIFTRYGTMIGTPAYMSPEQAEMSSMDVDTRTDVYALGVLLYELLTGTTPFPQEQLRSLGFGQIQKFLAEEEPEKPSTRVSTLVGRQKGPVSGERRVERRFLDTEIRGDLDWIVMKCLEKDRRRRYDTPNELAEDIRRHLAFEPVAARPPSTLYRFQKLVRRNRIQFIAVLAVLAALIAGLGLSVSQAVRAQRAEAAARERQAQAESIAGFLTEVFQSPNPERSGYSFTVADALGQATKKLEHSLTNQPAQQHQLFATLAQTYAAIGLHREALGLQERVVAYLEQQFGREEDRTLEALERMSRYTFDSGRADDAIRLQSEVVRVLTRRRGAEDAWTLQARGNLATHYHYAGRNPEAAAHYRDIVATLQRLKGPEHPDTLSAMGNLAVAFDSSGELRQARDLHARIYELRRKRLGVSHPDTLDSLSNLAVSTFGLDENEEALRLQRELVEQRRLVLGAEHPRTLMSMHYLAYFQQNKDPAGAIATHEQVLQLRRKVLGPEHPDTLITLHYQAYALESLGRLEEAIALRESVVRSRTKVQGADHPQTQGAMIALSESYLRSNRTRDALPLLERVSTSKPADATLALRVSALERWFRLESESKASVRRCLERLESAEEPLAIARMVLAVCLHSDLDPVQGRQAVRHARRPFEAAQKIEPIEAMRLARGLAELRAGHPADALPFFEAIVPSTGPTNPLQAAAAAYAALGLIQQSLSQDAREYSDLATRWATANPVSRENPLGGDLSTDRLVASIAVRELQAALKSEKP